MKLAGAPHDVLLVLDVTVGQNGLVQAREFMEAAGVNGIVLTKLDGTAKGGVAVPIAYELGLPVKLVGVGEQLDDLRPFDPLDFAQRARLPSALPDRRSAARLRDEVRRAPTGSSLDLRRSFARATTSILEAARRGDRAAVVAAASP